MRTDSMADIMVRLMEKRKLTGDALADKANLTPATISRLLNGHQKPYRRTVYRIAQVFGKDWERGGAK